MVVALIHPLIYLYSRVYSECFLISQRVDQGFEITPTCGVTEGLTGSEERGGALVESQAFFLPQYPKLLLFPPTCHSRRTARWTAQEVGMWLVPADRVALPRKEQSQQSNLLTALRCVSGQVLLSAIPQVLIYQLSVQTEHRPRLYFCLLL